MSYYIRAFCRSDKSPAFGQLQKFMSGKNTHYRLDGEVDDNNSCWTDFILHYKEGKLPILVEISWCEEDSSLGKEELEGFLEAVGPPGLSFKKWKVINHLKNTKYIITCQIPKSDADDDGYFSNRQLTNFLVDHFQAMIHEENSGFYYRDKKLLLKNI